MGDTSQKNEEQRVTYPNIKTGLVWISSSTDSHVLKSSITSFVRGVDVAPIN